jgi:hypothetical protein
MANVGKIVSAVAKAAKVGVKAAEKTLTDSGAHVKVNYNKQAMENSIKDNQLKTKRPDMSASRPVVSRPGTSRAIKINSNPSTVSKQLGGQHMGGHAYDVDNEDIAPHYVMWRDGGDANGLGHE